MLACSSMNSIERTQPSGMFGNQTTGLTSTGLPDTSEIRRKRTRSLSSYPSGNDRGMISMAPRSNSASTEHRAMTSSSLARFDGTGRPSWAWWMAIWDVLKPCAPLSIAWRSTRCMAAIRLGWPHAPTRRLP